MAKVNRISPLRGKAPSEYVLWCQHRSFDPQRMKALIKVSRDPDHKDFLGANKHIDAYAWGLPVQLVQTEDLTQQARPAADSVRDLLNALPALLARFPDHARTLSAYDHAQKLLAAGFTPVEAE